MILYSSKTLIPIEGRDSPRDAQSWQKLWGQTEIDNGHWPMPAFGLPHPDTVDPMAATPKKVTLLEREPTTEKKHVNNQGSDTRQQQSPHSNRGPRLSPRCSILAKALGPDQDGQQALPQTSSIRHTSSKQLDPMAAIPKKEGLLERVPATKKKQVNSQRKDRAC